MKRILTNRNFPDGESYEALLLADSGIVFWVGEDHSMLKIFDSPLSFSFAVDIDFITEKFTECGRTFDATKIPNLVRYPYA